ncbi:hypothetical protein PCE1_003886 [Barthelona sp. PCE]
MKYSDRIADSVPFRPSEFVPKERPEIDDQPLQECAKSEEPITEAPKTTAKEPPRHSRSLKKRSRENFQFDSSCGLLFDKYSEIVSTICDSKVSVFSSPTGSGKSTLIPSFVARSYYERTLSFVNCDKPLTFLMSQPRKFAARAIAQRLRTMLPEFVTVELVASYSIGSIIKRIRKCNDRRVFILITTENVAFRRVGKWIDIMMIDEVHERNIWTDVLLSMAKRRLYENKRKRIIISSACNMAPIERFFPNCTAMAFTQRLHPITDMQPAESTHDCFMRPAEYCADLVNQMFISNRDFKDDGHVLVFLPSQRACDTGAKILIRELGGMSSIGVVNPFDYSSHVEYLDAVRNMTAKKQEVIVACALYGRLPLFLQDRVMLKISKGARKVIFSTNVAETSVTIPGVSVVVDSSLVKLPYFNVATGVFTLRLCHAPLDSNLQRKGRAGRTRKGYYVKAALETSDAGSFLPEIQRVDLSHLILVTRKYGFNLEDMELPSPPDVKRCEIALQTLSEIGALCENGRLTELGRMLAEIPVTPALGVKLLGIAMLGGEFAYVTAAIIAVLTAGSSLFYFAKNLTGDMQRRAVAAHGMFRSMHGDIITLANVVIEASRVGYESAWCSANYVNRKMLLVAREAFDQATRAFTRLKIEMSCNFEGMIPNEIAATVAARFYADLRHAVIADVVMDCDPLKPSEYDIILKYKLPGSEDQYRSQQLGSHPMDTISVTDEEEAQNLFPRIIQFVNCVNFGNDVNAGATVGALELCRSSNDILKKKTPLLFRMSTLTDDLHLSHAFCCLLRSLEGKTMKVLWPFKTAKVPFTTPVPSHSIFVFCEKYGMVSGVKKILKDAVTASKRFEQIVAVRDCPRPRQTSYIDADFRTVHVDFDKLDLPLTPQTVLASRELPIRSAHDLSAIAGSTLPISIKFKQGKFFGRVFELPEIKKQTLSLSEMLNIHSTSNFSVRGVQVEICPYQTMVLTFDRITSFLYSVFRGSHFHTDSDRPFIVLKGGASSPSDCAFKILDHCDFVMGKTLTNLPHFSVSASRAEREQWKDEEIIVDPVKVLRAKLKSQRIDCSQLRFQKYMKGCFTYVRIIPRSNDIEVRSSTWSRVSGVINQLLPGIAKAYAIVSSSIRVDRGSIRMVQDTLVPLIENLYLGTVHAHISKSKGKKVTIYVDALAPKYLDYSMMYLDRFFGGERIPLHPDLLSRYLLSKEEIDSTVAAEVETMVAQYNERRREFEELNSGNSLAFVGVDLTPAFHLSISHTASAFKAPPHVSVFASSHKLYPIVKKALINALEDRGPLHPVEVPFYVYFLLWRIKYSDDENLVFELNLPQRFLRFIMYLTQLSMAVKNGVAIPMVFEKRAYVFCDPAIVDIQTIRFELIGLPKTLPREVVVATNVAPEQDDDDVPVPIGCLRLCNGAGRKVIAPCGHDMCIKCVNSQMVNLLHQFKQMSRFALDLKCHICHQIVPATFFMEAPFFRELCIASAEQFLSLHSPAFCCPSPDCGRFMVRSSKAPDIFHPREFCGCQDCHTRLCAICGGHFHHMRDCSHSIAFSGGFHIVEKDMLAEIDEDAMGVGQLRTCPVCSQVTEKYEGCLHVQCPCCSIHWCFLCGYHSRRERDVYNHKHIIGQYRAE